MWVAMNRLMWLLFGKWRVRTEPPDHYKPFNNLTGINFADDFSVRELCSVSKATWPLLALGFCGWWHFTRHWHPSHFCCGGNEVKIQILQIFWCKQFVTDKLRGSIACLLTPFWSQVSMSSLIMKLFHSHTFHGVFCKPFHFRMNHLVHLYMCVNSGLTSLSTIFQSYHDGVWLRQGAQCSLL